MKASFFCYSGDGTMLPLALRLKGEGHPVTLYIHEARARGIGTGLLPKTTTPTPPSGSVVIFDTTSFGAAGRAFRRQGHPVIGGNPFEQNLEIDRPAGVQLMRGAGIRVPETHPFRDYGTAIAFLRKTPGQWFVKVSGDQPCVSTYDAPDSEHMIRYLEWVADHAEKIEPFELQRRVTGTELSVNGWFDGRHFLEPFDLTMEEKHFLPGELGPRTGCESCVVWHASTRDLAEQTLVPLKATLAREGYIGPLDLNMKIDEGEPIGLEWTARLGWDATQAWMRLVAPLGEQLDAFARGGLPRWSVTGSRAMTLKISMPPYPSDDTRVLKATRGLPLDPEWTTSDDLDPEDVMMQGGSLVAAGASGNVGAVVASGADVPALRRTVLARASALIVPNKQYRIDPVSRWERDWPAVQDY